MHMSEGKFSDVSVQMGRVIRKYVFGAYVNSGEPDQLTKPYSLIMNIDCKKIP